MNICQQLVSDAQKANSLKELEAISNKADEIFFSDGNQEQRDLMTDDFWIEFTKVIRKRVMHINKQ